MTIGNAKGQMIVESMLILIVLFAMTFLISSTFRSGDFIAQIVSSPWKNLSGVIQNGVWAPPEASMQLHPSIHNRHISQRGAAAK